MILNKGILKQILNEDVHQKNIIVQILKVTKVVTQNFFSVNLTISDSECFLHFGFIDSKLMLYFENNNFRENSVIKILRYDLYTIINSTENTSLKVLFIQEFILIEHETAVIDNPIDFNLLNKLGKSKIISADINLINDLKSIKNDWNINIRVIDKKPIKTWSNNKGSGKFFTFEVKDNSGQIRIAVFRELVDKFYNLLEVDKAYQISNGIVKLADKQYSSNSNEYEIILNKNSIIKELTECNIDISIEKYNFISISEIIEKEKGDFVDIIGICLEIGKVEQISTTSSQQNFSKRDIILIDDTGYIILTLWNDQAINFNYQSQSVLLIHNGRIGEFRGNKYITLAGNSVMKVNPKEAQNYFITENISGINICILLKIEKKSIIFSLHCC